MKEYWKVIVPAVGLFFLVSASFTSTALSYVGEVVIVNLATEPVKSGHVQVCGQKFQLGELEQGKTKAIQYKVRSDSHFELVVEFAPGNILSKELGYVTSGRDFKHILTVKDDAASIELQ